MLLFSLYNGRIPIINYDGVCLGHVLNYQNMNMKIALCDVLSVVKAAKALLAS